ncbi:MAG: hypothetical protein ACLS6G_08245 [Christensenellales bacterium]
MKRCGGACRINTVLALRADGFPVLGYLMPAFEPALLMLAAIAAAPMEKQSRGSSSRMRRRGWPRSRD